MSWAAGAGLTTGAFLAGRGGTVLAGFFGLILGLVRAANGAVTLAAMLVVGAGGT